ncbi:MAG: DUF1804 family protein [Desulfuromonadaceae bacterium]
MAEKGKRITLEPVARQMFVDGKSLVDIEAELGVSRQSISDWKGRTKKPGDDKDEWDKARETKTSSALRLSAIFERELAHVETRQPGSIEQASLNALNQLGAMVLKFKALENTGASYDKGKVFLENLQWIIAYLRENDPEGLKTLAADFDAMTMQFKAELLNGNA